MYQEQYRQEQAEHQKRLEDQKRIMQKEQYHENRKTSD